MPKITFCGLLFQLHIKWETSYYWYHSCFLWRHTDVCFLSSKHSHGSVGTGGLCCGPHIFDWHLTGSRRPDPQNGQHPPDEISGAETEIQICAAGKNPLQWDSVCDSFSQLTGNRLKARWPSVLFFPDWIRCFFWFPVAPPCILSLNPPLSADVRWCWISFKSWVRAGYHILDANVMVISQGATHRRTDKKKHTLTRDVQCFRVLISSDVLLCN